jgi:rSAM/selenodomain-associated transferase 2
MNLSVIIPALDANDLLPAAVARLRGDLVGEIIIADGGTVPAPSRLGDGVTVITGDSGRGQQLHAGAAAAAGDWLLFLHADTRLADGWREAVRDHVRDHPGKAAFFRFVLDDASPAARRLERIVALRCRLLALPYGDQGLLISRRLYEAVGGFRPIPLMEDVDIIRRIGRARLRRLDVAAVTSAARYRREGYLRRMGRNLVCLSLFYAGVSPDRIRKLYA